MVNIPGWADDIFKEALEKFEDQKDVELETTGYEMTYEENEIGEVEYWVHGLIESKADLDIEVGGWFSHDPRDGNDTIYCNLVLRIDGERATGETEALGAHYDPMTESWGKLDVHPI